MSSFFDKKEEVISVELTQHGKYLLSIGKLDPHYYAFYDEDVLYDSNYAGYTELQNDIEKRILEETPSTKPQYVRHGIETEVSKTVEDYRSNKTKKEVIPQTIQKIYSENTPLGNSSFNTVYSPAWNLKFLDGEILNADSYLTGSYENLRVPQINLKTSEYVIKTQTGPAPGLEKEECGPLGPNDLEAYTGPDLNIINDLNITSPVFKDGTSLYIDQDNIVIQLDELNTYFGNDNFEIEVFMMENVSGSQGIEERVIPLKFIKPVENVVNDILIDVESKEEEITKENVEYFLDIKIDKELPDKYWANLGAAERKTDVFYSEDKFGIPQEKEKPDLSVQGLYKLNNLGPFGEEC